MNGVLRRVAYRKSEAETRETLLDKEWLVTNGLGGYASGSLAGVITRGFHGYLVAALPTPLGRMMMLNDLIEKVGLDFELLFESNRLQSLCWTRRRRPIPPRSMRTGTA